MGITTKNRKAKPIQRKEEECPNMETREKEFGTLLLQRRSVEMPVQLCIRVLISHMIYRPRSRNVILINRLISWLLGSSDSPKICDVHGWRPVLTLKSLACENLPFSGAHSLKEGDEGHEAILILWLTKFLHEALGFLLGELLTEVGKETEKLVSNHGVVVIFVIKLQDFNEVVESTLVLGVLACLVHGEDISLGEHLLALLGLTSDLFNGLEGWVQVAS